MVFFWSYFSNIKNIWYKIFFISHEKYLFLDSFFLSGIKSKNVNEKKKTVDEMVSREQCLFWGVCFLASSERMFKHLLRKNMARNVVSLVFYSAKESNVF